MRRTCFFSLVVAFLASPAMAAPEDVCSSFRIRDYETRAAGALHQLLPYLSPKTKEDLIASGDRRTIERARTCQPLGSNSCCHAYSLKRQTAALRQLLMLVHGGYGDVWSFDLRRLPHGPELRRIYHDGDRLMVVYLTDEGRHKSFDFFSDGAVTVYAHDRQGVGESPGEASTREPIIFSDGTSIERAIGGHAQCPSLLWLWLEKRSADEKVLWRRSLIGLQDPRTNFAKDTCENTERLPSDGGGRARWVTLIETIDFSLVPLRDDTFLVVDKDNRFIMRFDKDLQTKSPLIDREVFVVGPSDRPSDCDSASIQDDHDCLLTFLMQRYNARLRGGE